MMTTLRLVVAHAAALLGMVWNAWNPFSRMAWCRKQRRRLHAPGHSVVWLRGDVLAWAQWGARRGYFEVQQMDGLPYLRAVDGPSS